MTKKKCAYTRESKRFQWAEGAVWTGEMRGWGRVWGRWEKIGGGGGIAMFLLAAGTLINCTIAGNWYQKELCTHISQFCGKKKNDNLMCKHIRYNAAGWGAHLVPVISKATTWKYVQFSFEHMFYQKQTLHFKGPMSYLFPLIFSSQTQVGSKCPTCLEKNRDEGSPGYRCCH